MPEETSGQEKTEEPTPRRLDEARKKGDVAKSMEIPSAAVLLASLTTFYFLSEFILARFMMLLKHFLSNIHTIEIVPSNMVPIANIAVYYALLICGPLMAVILLTAILANYAQFGLLFTTEKITPKLDKINPVTGFGNLFSKQTMAQTVKSILKIILIGYIAYHEVMKVLPGILPLMDQQPYPILAFMARTAFWIFLKTALLLAVLAAADYAFQRWQFMEKMKMTKQEVKEEAKQTEGDPLVKGRIRSIQMEMARKRMMEEVPSADVIITNPTHLAVALKYDKDTMAAPLVVAKGAGIIAFRIRELAEENNIPIMEDKPLAQALYKNVEISEAIPDNLYQAVAEVLAYVYNLKGQAA